jgi:hypothetical protein
MASCHGRLAVHCCWGRERKGEGLTGERGGTGEEFKTAQHDGEDNARPWTAMSSGLVSRGEMSGMARLHLGEEGTSSDG